jgi:hypothetical protein
MNYPCLIALYIALALPAVAEDGPPREHIEFFEKHVRPVLAEHCYACHSAQAKRLEAGLRLDSREGVLQGGDSGAAATPGKPDESLLVEAVRYESFEMPPRNKLPKDQIDALVRWIAMGAPWPAEKAPGPRVTQETFDWRQRKAQHWSWEPIRDADPPAVRRGDWASNAIDQFVLARLEQNGLTPAPRADRRTLLRRLYFDLIGLPPAPDAVQAFAANTSPDAWERAVDRLLQSSHFGEKWARHWMDLVRYAETHGHEFDYPIHHAHRYRDYLIRAFNADVPYDQLIREHIAGDLLDDPRRHPAKGYNESIIGTGFWFLGEAVHAPTDVRGDEAIRIDNQIDVFSRTFLGLTVACARCHDHKFDPIPMEDYYALAGFLQSSRRQEAMLDPHGEIHKIAGRIRSLRAEGDKTIRAGWAAIDRTGTHFATNLLAAAQAGHASRAPSASVARWKAALADPAVQQPAHPLYAWGQLAVIATRPFDRRRSQLIRDLNALVERASRARSETVLFEDFDSDLKGWSATGEAFDSAPTSTATWDPTSQRDVVAVPGVMHSGLTSGRLRGVLRSPTFTITHPQIHYRLDTQGAQIRLIIDGYFMDVFNGLLFRGVTMNKIETGGQFAWQTQAGDIRNHIGRTAHIEIADQGDGFVALDEIRFSDGTAPIDPPHPLSLRILDDQTVTDLPSLAQAYGREWDMALGRWKRAAETPSDTSLVNWVMRHGLASDQPATEELTAKIAPLEKRIPTPQYALAITDGTSEDAPIHIRGNHRNTGDVVPRRFLLAIAGEDQPQIVQGSGRLELARRITACSNPFPARVLVNRLWHHLMGRGLAPTVDDFGAMGQPPTHPELLDWLAEDLRSNGWSMKHVIRSIVLSSTYRMSTKPNSDALAHRVDAANDLLHRMRIRRLPAESIRDAMLAVSGRLDPKQFGASVPVHLTPFMEGRGRPRSGPLDGNGRRSIYLEIRRNFLSPMMLAFDMPSPFSTMGRRSESNVPAQSLILMNDPFVIEQAEVWARRMIDEQPDHNRRVQHMFRLAFARPPSDRQLQRAMQFIHQQAELYNTDTDDLRVWSDLCHTLVNMKEFLYLN